jgi:hypothetical protein
MLPYEGVATNPAFVTASNVTMEEHANALMRGKITIVFCAFAIIT